MIILFVKFPNFLQRPYLILTNQRSHSLNRNSGTSLNEAPGLSASQQKLLSHLRPLTPPPHAPPFSPPPGEPVRGPNQHTWESFRGQSLAGGNWPDPLFAYSHFVLHRNTNPCADSVARVLDATQPEKSEMKFFSEAPSTNAFSPAGETTPRGLVCTWFQVTCQQ